MNKPPSLPKKPKAVAAGPRQLTRFLTELGSETIVTKDGESITRDQALAQTLWDLALGCEYEDDDGNAVYRHPDKAVAIFIMERREGRTPMTNATDEGPRMTAADKIDELAKARINAEADSIIPVSEPTANVGVPDHRD